MSESKSVHFNTSDFGSLTQQTSSVSSSNADDFELEVEYLGATVKSMETTMIGNSTNKGAERLWTPMLSQLCSIVPHARSANMLESVTLYNMANTYYEMYEREMTDDDKTEFVRISVMKRFLEMNEGVEDMGEELAMEKLKRLRIGAFHDYRPILSFVKKLQQEIKRKAHGVVRPIASLELLKSTIGQSANSYFTDDSAESIIKARYFFTSQLLERNRNFLDDTFYVVALPAVEGHNQIYYTLASKVDIPYDAKNPLCFIYPGDVQFGGLPPLTSHPVEMYHDMEKTKSAVAWIIVDAEMTKRVNIAHPVHFMSLKRVRDCDLVLDNYGIIKQRRHLKANEPLFLYYGPNYKIDEAVRYEKMPLPINTSTPPPTILRTSERLRQLIGALPDSVDIYVAPGSSDSGRGGEGAGGSVGGAAGEGGPGGVGEGAGGGGPGGGEGGRSSILSPSF